MFWLNLKSMGAKVISLSLEHVGWQILGSIAIVPAQSSSESRSWDTPQSTFANDVSPSRLSLVNGLVEEVIEQQIFQVRIVAVCAGDVLEKDRSDDAATSPHQCNRWLVELP